MSSSEGSHRHRRRHHRRLDRLASDQGRGAGDGDRRGGAPAVSPRRIPLPGSMPAGAIRSPISGCASARWPNGRGWRQTFPACRSPGAAACAGTCRRTSSRPMPPSIRLGLRHRRVDRAEAARIEPNLVEPPDFALHVAEEGVARTGSPPRRCWPMPNGAARDPEPGRRDRSGADQGRVAGVDTSAGADCRRRGGDRGRRRRRRTLPRPPASNCRSRRRPA